MRSSHSDGGGAPGALPVAQSELADRAARQKRIRNKIPEWPLHVMLIPGVIVIFVYSYLPMYGLRMAFQDFRVSRGLFGEQEWVGFENFRFLFQMPNFLNVLRNTLWIAVLKIAFGLLAPLTVALLLNELNHQGLKRTIQTMIYLPHFLSWVILGGILVTILSPSSGLVNQALGWFGVPPIFFLGSNDWFVFTLITTELWKSTGWGTIIYLAAIAGIDPNLYEAATIDGAGRLKQTIHVTLPGIIHVVALLLVLSLGDILNAGFDQVFNLYNPLVYETGDIIDTLVYRVGLLNAQFSLGAAIGMFKSAVSLVLISSSYLLATKYLDYRIF